MTVSNLNKKVVSIHDWSQFKLLPNYQGEILPVKDEIYTVRDVVTYPDNTIGIRLVEIVNVPKLYINGIYECTFDVRHFRPVDYDYGETMATILESELIEVENQIY